MSASPSRSAPTRLSAVSKKIRVPSCEAPSRAIDPGRAARSLAGNREEHRLAAGALVDVVQSIGVGADQVLRGEEEHRVPSLDAPSKKMSAEPDAPAPETETSVVWPPARS